MNPKIIVIDDDKDIAELVKMVLEMENFDVMTVIDPQQAISAVKEFRPDAILLDILMPKIDGWSVFKQIRSDPDLAKIPIAMFTAKSQRVDAMVGLHVMKADDYITKPFGKQELIDKTNELIRKNR